MKYLWVEDFDGDMNRDINEDYWRKFFSLDKKNVELCVNLEDALKIMTDHPDSFDAVLLDINLVNTNNDSQYTKNDWERWYEEYFQEYIDQNYYNDPDHRRNGTGILLYLYLRERYHFPKERICFLSAYAGNESNAGATEYQNLKATMSKLGCKLGMAREKPAKQEQNMNSDKTTNPKYGTFPTGVQTPEASPNKNSENDGKYDKEFLENFIEKNETEYVNFRRFLLDASQLILDHYEKLPNETEKENFVRIRHKCYFQRVHGSMKEAGKQTYSKEYFIELLQRLRLYPLNVSYPQQEKESMVAMLESLIYFGESIVEPTDRFVARNEWYNQCTIQKNENGYGCGFKSKPHPRECGVACTKESDDCPYCLSGAERANIAVLKRLRNCMAHGHGPSKEDFLHSKELIVCIVFQTVFDMKEVDGYEELEAEFLSVTSENDIETIVSHIKKYNFEYFNRSTEMEYQKKPLSAQLQQHLKTNDHSFVLDGNRKNPAFLYQYYLNYFVTTDFTYNFDSEQNVFVFKPVVNASYLKLFNQDEKKQKRLLQYAYNLFIDGT